MGGRRPRHTAELDHRNEEVERCEFGERRREGIEAPYGVIEHDPLSLDLMSTDTVRVTRLGFLLDSDSCIGCHACTVACKSEHDVPLGVNRTWVKYIETGTFPDVARKFSVMRCNQCDDAVHEDLPDLGAYRAENGVVDFQDDNCIGASRA